MGDSHGRWSNLLVWTLIHLARCAPQQQCVDPNYIDINADKTGRYCEETFSSMNCSLGQRKSEDTTFPCQIKRGKLNESAMGPLTPCPYPGCKPALLQSLKLTKQKRTLESGEQYRWSAIEFTFSLPPPIGSPNDGYGAGAIEVTFSSDNKTLYDDMEFGQIYRVFDFNSYMYTSIDADPFHPNNTRILRFPCFMGFYFVRCQSDSYKVYSLRLKTFSKWRTETNSTPFTEITYNITVYGYYVYHNSQNKSTIAVTLFPGNRDVTVVFDPATDSKVFRSTVSLINAESDELYDDKQVFGEPKPVLFKNTPDGLYYVSIVTCEGSTCSSSTKSHNITVGSPRPEHRPGLAESTSDEGLPFIKWFLPVMGGAVTAITLLALLCHHRWKTHTRLSKNAELSSLPKVLLIYSNNNQINSDLAKELVAFCNRNMQMKVIYDQLDDERYSINDEGYSHWYREKLEESSAAIILWTPGSDEDNQDGERTCNEFNTGVTMALNSKIDDHKKLVCLYLVKSHKLTVPPDIQKEARVYNFPEKSSQIFTFLLGHTRSRPKYFDNNSRFKKLVSELEDGNLIDGNRNQTTPDEVPELKGRQETIPLKNIDEEILDLKRKVFSTNLSNSSNSSASNTEGVPVNPDCPIHGEVLNNKHRPHPKRGRPYLRDHKHPPRGFDLEEIEPLQPCHHPQEYNNVVHLPAGDFFDYDFTPHFPGNRMPHPVREHVFHDDFDCIYQENSVLYESDLDYQRRVNDRHVHHNAHNAGFHQHLEWNRPPHHPSYCRDSERNTRDSEHSFPNMNNGRVLLGENSFDENSQEMSLTSKHPKFYLEEEEANDSYISFHRRRSNSVDSLTSNSSNNSKYSKRSASIDSFELKQSFQKFI